MPRQAKLRPACPEAEPDESVRADYEVGYKKPPKHTRFQSGQSGNPKGRPPGSKSLKTLIDRELETKVTVREGGRVVKLTKRQLLVKQLIKKAVEGDHRSQQILLKFDQELATSGRSANDNVPPADAPLEEDDRAILGALMAMLESGTGGPDREKASDRPADDGGTEDGT
jgi:Family of unknown function (DUF5681)